MLTGVHRLTYLQESAMALSVVDLYARILPRTNCKDCGFPTCLAFAGMVVSEKLPLKNCPHIPEEILGPAQAELEEQYRQGKWLKKDMAAEALSVAREKAASTDLGDMARRVGGVLEDGKAKGPFKGQPHIRLPYFNKSLLLTTEKVLTDQGEELTRNEQTFVYIHLAAGSHAVPTGNMKSLKEFPNTVSKIVSMQKHVEIPLSQAFSGRVTALAQACTALGGTDVKDRYDTCSLAFQFRVFPKVYVTLLFWDENDGFEAEVKLLFDETVMAHMDVESVMFMSEHLARVLTE